MTYLIVIVAFILTWIFIEITLFLSNKNHNEFDNDGKISYKKFIFYLRGIAVALIILTIIYMHYFGNISLVKVIQYCLGIITND
tara:strand:+ start:305 stop:556 length:252 start_codon:yes stop_codon:yes gene_type:complete